VLLLFLWLLLACACGWFGFHLARQNGRLLLRIDALEGLLRGSKGGIAQGAGAPSFGFPAGTVLSDFSLPLLTGGSMTLSQWRGRTRVLIFLNPSCRFCRDMLPELGAVLPKDTATADPVPLIITSGTLDENRRFFEGHGISCPVLVQEKPELTARYHVNGTPLAFVVDERGATVGNALVGAEPILAIFRATAVRAGEPGVVRGSRSGLAGSKLRRDGLKAGTAAPDFRLPTLDGGKWRSATIAAGKCFWYFQIRIAILVANSHRTLKSYTENPGICRFS
jgi:peroxiredoxin